MLQKAQLKALIQKNHQVRKNNLKELIMNLEEKESYDQANQNFQDNKHFQDEDIDAPPFDNSFSGEDQNRNQEFGSTQDSLSNDEDYDTDDSLDDNDLEDEDDDLDLDEDLKDEDSAEEEQNGQFRNDF